MGALTRKEKRDEEEAKKIKEDTPRLPEGYYWDDDDMLRTKEGAFIDDGCYLDENGCFIMYEGNFLKEFA